MKTPSLFLQNLSGQLLFALQDSVQDILEALLDPSQSGLDTYLKNAPIVLIWTGFLLLFMLFYNYLLFYLLYLTVRALRVGIQGLTP